LTRLHCLRPMPAVHGWLLFAALTGVAFAQSGERLRSGSELDYPPYAVVDEEGRAGGLSVDLLREVAARAGYEVSFEVAPWADLKDALAEGQLDVLPFVARTPEREELFDFSQPYLTTATAVVVRSDGPALGKPEDLNSLEIAVMSGDATDEYVHDQGLGMRVVRSRSYQDALRDLSVGRVDAVVVPRLVARHLIADLGLSNLRLDLLQLPGTRRDWCFAVPKGDTALVRALDGGLAEILADGTYDQIAARWLGPPEADEQGRFWLIGGGGVLGLVIAAAGIAFVIARPNARRSERNHTA
jgi:ABC-type amino acid transport substrate-binding protein